MRKTQHLGITEDGKVYRISDHRCRLIGHIDHVAVLNSEGRRLPLVRFEGKGSERAARGKENLEEDNAN